MRYELMTISKPYNDTPEARINNVIDVVTRCGGTAITVEDWKRRKLAYEVDGYQEAHYIICRFNSDSKDVLKAIDGSLKHNDLVLKHVLCREIKR